MNKLKMSALTATAAALVGTGALAAAPSAPAMPTLRAALCAEIQRDLDSAVERRDELEEWYGPNYWAVIYWDRIASDNYKLYADMC
jgi:hypothetical protein